MRKVIVLSLGGSLIVPDEVDYGFIESFKRVVRKNYGRYKFVVVCGGGVIARKYISILKSQGKSLREQAFAGIRATRMNARLMMQIFGKEANDVLPRSMKEVKSNLERNKIVFCGALRYADKETSDGTSAKLANYLETDFINLTNVQGVYTSNPAKSKSARFIPRISWRDFEKKALKIKYAPGQHFVLDQNAAILIRKNRIKTYVIGRDVSNLDKLLNGGRFKGSVIEG